jgi:coenzyme PQQ precursor peptide PqqA
MTWKTPRIVEVQVGMEINMYVCATRKKQQSDLPGSSSHLLRAVAGVLFFFVAAGFPSAFAAEAGSVSRCLFLPDQQTTPLLATTLC